MAATETSRSNRKVHAALVVACLALALAGYAAIRGRGGAAAGAQACIDQEARDQADRLRRMLVERDALIARLARVPGVPAPPSGELATADGPSQWTPTPLDPGPRRYVHFEIPNPAVTVTQKDDGTYDIRTTDPTLAGSVLQITAVTKSGEEDKLFIRIP